jgi:hypothetical protein
VLSDRILKWSKKDGFYTSYQVKGGFCSRPEHIKEAEKLHSKKIKRR